MKILDILTEKGNFQRRKVFKIALDAGSYISQRVYLKIVTDEGIYGFDDYDF